MTTTRQPRRPTPARATDGEATGEPIKIGVFSNNEGAFAPFEGQTWGGAMLPLINRGATPVSGDSTEGVENATIAGHPIEIVYGGSDSTPTRRVEEARRLVEQEGSTSCTRPLSGSEGIAIANYCLEQPDVTFVNGTSGAQDTTLKIQCPNFYRFHTDGAQWMAGLGDYAYNELGWRRVVTIGDDYDFPYTQIAGFVAEFCSLGGERRRAALAAARRGGLHLLHRPDPRRTSTASTSPSAAPGRLRS